MAQLDVLEPATARLEAACGPERRGAHGAQARPEGGAGPGGQLVDLVVEQVAKP